MNVHRADKKDGNFTQIANSIIQDKRLSLKARGLMAVLLSLHPNWNLNIAGLVTFVGRDGRDSVAAAFHELQRYGFVIRKKNHDAQGKFLKPEYEVYEALDANNSPQTGFPETGKPDTGNPPLCNTITSKTVSLNKTGVEGQSISKILEKDTSPVITQSASATDEVSGFPLSDYASRVDQSMEQNLEMARSRHWGSLDASVTKNRSFSDVFGKQPQIAWTSSEYGYLREIAQFCLEQWSGQDPLAATEAIIRAAFRKEGKAHQILKYWVEHSRSKVSLRPFLTLGGGAQNSTKRQDILKELAVDVKV